MKGRRNSLVAWESVPLFLVLIAATGLAWYYIGWFAAVPPALFLVGFYFLFRDPRRAVPSHPLAVVSPVDGEVIDVAVVDDGIAHASAHKIIIRIDSFGTYTARSPVEGTLIDYRSRIANRRNANDSSDDMSVERPDNGVPGLWVRTDEGDDVLLRFHGYRFGIVPKAFSRYGERLGQGQRCAYLRLTRFAEVYLPINSRVVVRPGKEVLAGSDILGTLPHP